MKRKITILTIAFLSSVLMCANVFAAATGRCGDSITWTLDDSGNLTLSGSGEMWNYNYGDSPFKYYGIKTVTIGDGITSIGDYAFMGCTGMTELTLPNSVTSIEDSAFSDCSGLANITSLAEIPPVCGSGVFDGVNKTNCELIVPIVSVVAYKEARGWKEFSNISWRVVISGRCGDSITWTLYDSGNLTLSGSGEMWNYGYGTSPFKDYGIRKVTIGDGITSIGDNAFHGCSGLTELTLPNSITSIGWYAFGGCSGLTELTLPNSLVSIGTCAFFGCSGLTELTLPNSVTSIGESAFKVCSGLTELTLPSSVTSIGWNAFEGCTGLTELTLPNSITSIGNSAFKGCSGLTKLTLPNSVTSIGDYVLKGCSGLTELTLPSSVTSIGESAFEGCSGLTELTLPNSVTSIGERAFQYCSGLTKLTLSNSLTEIGDIAFEGCRGLTELILPSSVTSIGRYAFSRCTGLEKITVESGNSRYDSRDNCNSIIDTETNTLIVGCKNSIIPNSVRSIGYYAFRGCRGLTELILPNSVRSIGYYAFLGCSGLAKITSLAEIPPVCGSGVFDGVNKTNCELIVPEGSVAAYKQAEVWNEFSNISGFSGVEDTVADGNTIRVIGNQIEISGDFTSVEVYGVNGTLIYKGKDNVVTVPSVGIYLVHVAGKTRKIVVE